MEGIVIAEVLNAVTTTSQTITLLYLSGGNGGVALHTADYEPETLRISLSSGLRCNGEKPTRTRCVGE